MKLLDWIQSAWTGDTISLRDIDRQGPRPFRNQRDLLLELTKILVTQGWLIPADHDARQHNTRRWRVVRRTPNKEWKSAYAQVSPATSHLSPQLATAP